jgi:hypothetical protein
MEQCTQHKDLTEKTEKVLNVVEEIKAVIVGDLKDPKQMGLISRINTLETKIESLEKAKNSIVNIAFKVIGSLAVGGISIKTILDAMPK